MAIPSGGPDRRRTSILSRAEATIPGLEYAWKNLGFTPAEFQRYIEKMREMMTVVDAMSQLAA